VKRRSFLKDAAFLAAAAAAAPSLASCRRSRSGDPEAVLRIARDFSYGSGGTFKVMQLTDTHYIAGDPRSERALRNVEEMLDAEHPDLVIHTGDIVFGRPDLQSAREILQPIVDRGIPFAVALGNHDSQFGATREEMFDLILQLPGCVNLPPKEGVYGCSNDVITLSGPDGVDRVLYLFDSMDAVILKGEEEIHSYDYIRFSQLEWYRSHSRHFTELNGGRPIPSLAFFHIPLCEVTEGLANGGRLLAGNNEEPPCPSRLNSGLLAQMREMGDIQAIVTGHDHDCDYVLDYSQMYYIYGRFSGCDTVYNHLGPSGARLFEFTRGKSSFRTWVRLYGGAVQQELTLDR
jgi:DNA repair exonuclease SbcCD nuclease subunit